MLYIPQYYQDTLASSGFGVGKTASELYDQVVFKTNGFYNRPAPDPWFAFAIAATLATFAFLQYVMKLYQLKQRIVAQKWQGTLKIRVAISAYIDNDAAGFTILKFAAQSFFILGGIQLNFQAAFFTMLVLFAMESFLDLFRIVLGFVEANSLADYVATCDLIENQTRETTTLKPTNVYEDLSRGKNIVGMVYVTQIVLTGLSVIDMFFTPTHTCLDGTANCPVTGTLGSWLSYVLGVFMAIVFLLGPKTSFGQSELNPAYWVKLLLMAKHTRGPRWVKWHDPVTDQVCYRSLSHTDWRIWMRLCMSFVVNGIGFHVLVHALPIQVAQQSNLTGIVFRAVGMMHLVDLDDTPGCTMTLVDKDKKPE